MGALAILLGVGGGSLVAGSRLKGDIVERLEEEAKVSSRAAETRAARDDGSNRSNRSDESDGATDDPTAVPASTDLLANQPAVEEEEEEEDSTDVRQEPSLPTAEDDTVGSGQERSQSVLGTEEPSAPVANTASGDPTPEPQALSDNGGDAGQGIDPEASRKLARIFAAMRPEDAAAVLQAMLDPEVRAILLGMADRQAAAILGDFEAARAASLSQLVLATRLSGS